MSEIRERHSHLVVGAESKEALRANPSRSGLVLQNTGANPVYIAFGRPATVGIESFKIAAGEKWPSSGWGKDCPRADLHAIGTAGDALAILEFNNEQR